MAQGVLDLGSVLGPPGPPGPMVGRWVGAWNNTLVLSANDIVTYEGSTFRALVDGPALPAPDTNPNFDLAKRGEPGNIQEILAMDLNITGVWRVPTPPLP